MKKIKVLIVEDLPFMRESLAKQVTEITNGNAKIDLAAHGGIAVKYVEDGNKYDLIIMNIEMPVLRGPEAGVCIRNLGYTGPIIGHTAHGDSEAKHYMIEGKMNAIISRPNSGGELYQIMAEFNLCTKEAAKAHFAKNKEPYPSYYMSILQRNPNLKF